MITAYKCACSSDSTMSFVCCMPALGQERKIMRIWTTKDVAHISPKINALKGTLMDSLYLITESHNFILNISTANIHSAMGTISVLLT